MIATVGLVLLIACVAGGDHRAAVGEEGESIINSLFAQEIEAERSDYDTGCGLLYCYGSCDQCDPAWLCWMEAGYERYGYSPEQGWYDLPISVDAIADCTVYHLGSSSCDESETEVGEGEVRAEADCWVNTIFSGVGVQDGGCACTELW